jgi:hypothetical protein
MMPKLVFALGILCVMAAMAADVWVMRQETAVHETLGWTPASGVPAPSDFDRARLTVFQANLPMYQATVTAIGVVGWLMIAGSLAYMVAAAARPRRSR